MDVLLRLAVVGGVAAGVALALTLAALVHVEEWLRARRLRAAVARAPRVVR